MKSYKLKCDAFDFVWPYLKVLIYVICYKNVKMTRMPQFRIKSHFVTVICHDMRPFQDEPEEKPAARQPTLRLLGDEPEERPRGTKRPLVSRQVPACLFQDEPEETERCPSTSSRGVRQVSHVVDQQSSSDDEGVSAAPTLSVGWSAMHMFAKARFMSNVSECGKPERKTRPYDNSKRIAKAAEVDQRKSRTYKESALEPQRLISLKQSARCKCFLNACGPAINGRFNFLIYVLILICSQVPEKTVSKTSTWMTARSFCRSFGIWQSASKILLQPGCSFCWPTVFVVLQSLATF